MSHIKLSSRVVLPNSVKEAQAAYKKARKNLVGRSYWEVLKKRFISMKKDFKIHKAVGVVFTFLGLRWFSDYKKMKSSGIKELKIPGIRSKLDLVGYALSSEIARDPQLRNAVAALAKEYPYLYMRKNGEIFLTSYTGSIMDKTTVLGKIFNSEVLIPSQAEKRLGKKVFGQKLDLNLILNMGSPKFEKASFTSRIAGAIPVVKAATAAAVGRDEIRVFYPNPVGSATPTTERKISFREVRSKRIMPSTTAGKRIILLRLKAPTFGSKPELFRLELDEKKAQAIYDSIRMAA